MFRHHIVHQNYDVTFPIILMYLEWNNFREKHKFVTKDIIAIIIKKHEAQNIKKLEITTTKLRITEICSFPNVLYIVLTFPFTKRLSVKLPWKRIEFFLFQNCYMLTFQI